MKHCKVIIEDYGKIKYAEIAPAPMTLFVGDNNSGKSYIMNLLWGIQNMGMPYLLGYSGNKSSENQIALCQWMEEKINSSITDGDQMIAIREIAPMIQTVIDEEITKNKDLLVRRIFNSEKISIGGLKIVMQGLDDVGDMRLSFESENDVESVSLNCDEGGWKVFRPNNGTKIDFADRGCCWFFVRAICCMILGISFRENDSGRSAIYLPAARTGFMLTKDIINSVARENTFNIDGEPESVTPFVRPINHFLDVMNSLASDEGEHDDRKELIQYIENDMVAGSLDMNSLPNREVLYVPQGKDEEMPLRTVSAVVSELAPLVLILKHKKQINAFFYEEPEMCLHPQLQNKIAKVICNMANMGIEMYVTSHSDIILQYINNMICLSESDEQERILHDLSYTANDMIHRDAVRVYQLCICEEGYTSVEELPCGKNGFAAETFNDALDKIMEEGYIIQG